MGRKKKDQIEDLEVIAEELDSELEVDEDAEEQFEAAATEEVEENVEAEAEPEEEKKPAKKPRRRRSRTKKADTISNLLEGASEPIEEEAPAPIPEPEPEPVKAPVRAKAPVVAPALQTPVVAPPAPVATPAPIAAYVAPKDPNEALVNHWIAIREITSAVGTNLERVSQIVKDIPQDYAEALSAAFKPPAPRPSPLAKLAAGVSAFALLLSFISLALSQSVRQDILSHHIVTSEPSNAIAMAPRENRRVEAVEQNPSAQVAPQNWNREAYRQRQLQRWQQLRQQGYKK